MDYVNVGTSGLQVSRIGLGCMSFGDSARGTHPWTLDEDRSRALIRHALDAGITFFDTANVYSLGSSEEMLGRALQGIPRDEIVIATKVHGRMRPGPHGAGLSRKSILAEAEASLRRLGVDYIDLYQIHRLDRSVPAEEILETLDDLVRAGKVRYLGASSMYAWEFQRLLHLQAQNGWSRFVSMQEHYNLLYREAEREMLPLCEHFGIGTFPWSPLARGKVARPWDQRTARSDTDEFGRDLYPDVSMGQAVAGAVAEVARHRDCEMAEVALAWLLGRSVVSAPIVGATNAEQLATAVRAATLSLTAEEAELLGRFYAPQALLAP